MEIKKSLEPVAAEGARLLILGSMPGEESLRRQEYYGYPRNHFWTLIADITESGKPDNYPSKISMAMKNGIALWDVIGSCTREGSLDTNIRDERPNSLLTLIDRTGSLRAVFFNGQKAAGTFKKYFGFTVLEERGLDYRIMPSTSPANTASYEKKRAAWSEILNYLQR